MTRRLASHLLALAALLALAVPHAHAGPGCDSCVTTPDTCCAGLPAISGDEHPPFSNHVAVGTRQESSSWPYVVTIFDLASPPPSPLEDQDWASVIRYNGPSNSWKSDSLGSVFGLTIDEYGNIFVTQASCYANDLIGQVFGAAPGAVYRIDAVTGKINVFCVLPNAPDPNVSFGNLPELGNISYDCLHKQFFVTNLEDGRIYRIKPVGVNGPTGTVMQTFDPLTPDNFAPGWAPLGERIWGVQWHRDRVFYGVWREDEGAQSAAVANEVRSVGLNAGGGFILASDRHELFVPALPGEVHSNPVSDISFTVNGTMLLGEHGIQNKTAPVVQRARALEYQCSVGCWVQTSSFKVGPPGFPANCAGGVDYDHYAYAGGVLGRTWASADLMHHLGPYPDILSGYQGLRPTGGSHLNSILMDSDGNFVLTDKAFIGDIEVVGCPGPNGTICGKKFEDLNHNGVEDAGEPPLAGWIMTLTGIPGTFTATTDANGQYCFLDVPPGSYTLFEQLQAGWAQTKPTSGSYALTVSANQVTTGLDFGNYSCSGGGSGCATAPPSMAAWWRFDEAVSSLTAADATHLSPPKNVAQLIGGASITAGGHTGRMLCVPNELDGAVVPNSNQLGLSFGAQSFAIDAWVNLNNSAVGPRTLVEKRVPVGVVTRGWAVYFNGLQAFIEIGIGFSKQNLPGPTVTAGVWNHIAVSVDRTTGSGRWYLNGVLMPGFNFTPTPGGVQSNADVYIGRTSPLFPIGPGFDGCIDDLEIFNAPLSAQTVQSLYAAGAAGKCSDIVRLPEVTSICSGQSSTTVCFNICNSMAVTQSYSWSLAGLPVGPGCTVAGPTSFSPASGTVTLGPGACSPPICVTIARPAGLTAQNATSCYQLTVINDSTGVCTVRPGKIRADNTCWCATPASSNLVSVGPIGVPIGWGVEHPCGSGSALSYRVIAVYQPTDHADPVIVRLNGLPPGEPVLGMLDIAPGGEPGNIEVSVSLANGHDAAAFYEIVLEADTDGDGVYERMSGTQIVSTYDADRTDAPVIDRVDYLHLRATPNPFTAGTTFRFALARAEDVNLAVYDIGGRLVQRLVRGRLAAGAHVFEWDGRGPDGRAAATGVYFARMRSGSGHLEMKIVKLR